MLTVAILGHLKLDTTGGEMNHFLMKSTIAGGVLALACAANAGVVFSQPYDGSGNAYSSQNDTTGGNGNFATAWDDFQLSGATNLNGASWTGIYFNPGPPGNITAFTLGIYADAGGTPGALMMSTNIAGNSSESCGGTAVCSYSASFADFQAGPGTYWLAVVPDMGFPPQWGWATSAVGTKNAYQCFLGTCAPIVDVNTGEGVNLAFSMMGAPVPEPETLALMLAGLGVLGVSVRSRRRAKGDAA